MIWFFVFFLCIFFRLDECYGNPGESASSPRSLSSESRSLSPLRTPEQSPNPSPVPLPLVRPLTLPTRTPSPRPLHWDEIKINEWSECVVAENGLYLGKCELCEMKVFFL